MLSDQFGNLFVRNDAGAFRVNRNVHGVGNTDGVGNLDLALFCQAGSNDVLSHVAAGISGRTVYLCGILAGESTAAVGAGTAVSIHNDLTTGQTAVTLRSADDEAAGRVNQELRVLEHFGREYRTNDLIDHSLNEFGLHLIAFAHFRSVLSRKNNCLDRNGTAVHVTHRHLALSVRTKVGHLAGSSHQRLLFNQTVSVINRSRHQRVCFVTGVTKHQALITGAFFERIVLSFIDALSDIGRLFVISNQDCAAFMVNTVTAVIVTNALQGVANDLGVIHICGGRNFAGEHDGSGRAQSFSGNSSSRILFENSVENGVRNLVGDFIGMAFGYGLRSKKVFFCRLVHKS